MNDAISPDTKTNNGECFERSKHQRIDSYEQKTNVEIIEEKGHVEKANEIEKKRDKRERQRKKHLRSLDIIDLKTNKKKIFQV